MTLDVEKLARLEARLELATASRGWQWDAYRERLATARRSHAAAVKHADESFRQMPIASLNELSAAELQAAKVDASLLRDATADMAAAGEIKALMDAEHASTASLGILVNNLRRYANANGNLHFGDQKQ
jgi:hypothetical protein